MFSILLKYYHYFQNEKKIYILEQKTVGGKMKWYDTIHKIVDFKELLEEKTTDALIRKNLRITIQDKPLGDMTVETSVILTFPHEDEIIRHFVGKKYFNRYFYKDRNFSEYKEYQKFIKDCYKKVEDLFGEVTEGFWSLE